MTTKEIVEHMLDKSETVGNEGYADRLIARAQATALASIADSLEKLAGCVGTPANAELPILFIGILAAEIHEKETES